MKNLNISLEADSYDLYLSCGRKTNTLNSGQMLWYTSPLPYKSYWVSHGTHKYILNNQVFKVDDSCYHMFVNKCFSLRVYKIIIKTSPNIWPLQCSTIIRYYIFFVPTPNKLFKSASLNLNGIFDTWRRFGPEPFPCDAEDVDWLAESGDKASPLSKSVCYKNKKKHSYKTDKQCSSMLLLKQINWQLETFKCFS